MYMFTVVSLVSVLLVLVAVVVAKVVRESDQSFFNINQRREQKVRSLKNGHWSSKKWKRPPAAAQECREAGLRVVSAKVRHRWILSVTNIQCHKHIVLHSVTRGYSVRDRQWFFCSGCGYKCQRRRSAGLRRVLPGRKSWALRRRGR